MRHKIAAVRFGTSPAAETPWPIRRLAAGVIMRAVLDGAGLVESARSADRERTQAEAIRWLRSSEARVWVEWAGLDHWLTARLREPLPAIDRDLIDTQRRARGRRVATAPIVRRKRAS
jgi:hypothetical protein